MKNIRNYRSELYNNKDKFEEVEPNIFKKPSNDNFAIQGLLDEEKASIIRKLDGWKKGEKEFENEYLTVTYKGVKYFKDIEEEEEDNEDSIIYIQKPLEEIYVTSIIFEQEPEYNENDPSNEIISQYPLEDIQDEFLVHCGEPYTKENKNDKVNSYVEFASTNIENIRKVRSIIGKHVYTKQEGEMVKLIIE
ncbi:hypothetical protein H8356DRAFT_1302171 [Neocallimastix lanati (nom. inval.)]|jgi:hypothetical protein|uniref:Uncharacterized protein n=1 Tax=Neocallimastix californiae TaxID=1754190 RepID=A0A1Y2DMC8_9FUNG|nr:hypothetical protein H8356DRAFT_1302171 [Neocallimastix sp. JGI-2020a]ORY60417.1 hypothetical protein LY90DRAFT_701217 [Neocallimastix californiae]|eukprot:ORY60417.1 hypothetical protein LY90DRAFT_701217 [Neocallimastix californiae]